MILVSHSFKGFEASQKGTDTFLLTNRQGDFFLSGYRSKYRGLFFRCGDQMMRTVECITPDRTPTELRHELHSVVEVFNGASIRYMMRRRSLLLRVEGNLKLDFTLDMRYIYDFSDQGRIYSIKDNVVEYRKMDGEHVQYQAALAVAGRPIQAIGKWTEQFYDKDQKRGSGLDSLWVYDGFSIECSGKTDIVIGFGSDRENALHECEHCSQHFDGLIESEMKYCDHISPRRGRDVQVNLAYAHARNSLDSLQAEISGRKSIYAGLPWFFQFWSRDEAITCGGLIAEGRIYLAKEILMRLLSSMQPDSSISNRIPPAGLGSADAAGLVLLRLEQLVRLGQEKKMTEHLFSDSELEMIRDRLRLRCRLHDGLILNKRKETWMDTDWKGDYREGARIEIQAYHLANLRFLRMMEPFSEEKKAAQDAFDGLRRLVREKFFDGNTLADGADDPTIRPNVFLAYYACPELLSKEEWGRVFHNSLAKLYLDWGGIASIQRDSELFSPIYTGEDNRSYHRGDSWFWINNIAAICLHRLDRKRFYSEVHKILEASAREILFHGAIGHSAELSSASRLESEGCLMQAWSAATFIELMEELY